MKAISTCVKRNDCELLLVTLSRLSIAMLRLENALFDEKIEKEGWTQVCVKSNGYQEVAYSILISAPQGSIGCLFNDKFEDHNAPESRLEWRDIMFQVYQIEAA